MAINSIIIDSRKTMYRINHREMQGSSEVTTLEIYDCDLPADITDLGDPQAIKDKSRINCPGIVDIKTNGETNAVRRYVYTDVLEYTLKHRGSKYIISYLKLVIIDDIAAVSIAPIQTNVINLSTPEVVGVYRYGRMLFVKLRHGDGKDTISHIMDRFNQFVYNGTTYHPMVNENGLLYTSVYKMAAVTGKGKVNLFAGTVFAASSAEIYGKTDCQEAAEILNIFNIEE